MHNLKVVDSTRKVYSENLDTQSKENMNFPPKNPEREIDQKLVEKSQKGDKQAFGVLVEKYHKKLYRLLSRILSKTHLSKRTEQYIIFAAIALFTLGFTGLV